MILDYLGTNFYNQGVLQIVKTSRKMIIDILFNLVDLFLVYISIEYWFYYFYKNIEILLGMALVLEDKLHCYLFSIWFQ
jgi:hypothetical protein